MENNIYRWCFEINLDDVRSEEVSNTPNDCCFLCGKKINKTEYVVHYLTNGNLISTDQDIDISQGFFPIGNECKKRLPNNFYFKATE